MAKALPESCLNCGHKVTEEMTYCPHCGQKNRKSKLPLRIFISDFFEDYFTVDARFFQSIGKLVFAPGALTKEFNRGKRKTYIAPFRLYIFISFLFFFSLAIHSKYTADFENNSIIEFGDTDEEQSAQSDSTGVASIKTVEEDSLRTQKQDESSVLDVNLDSDSETSELEEFFEERALRANDNPELFVQTLFKSASITMFIMLPFFGLLLYIFHFKFHRYYVEHLVHSVHFHSFLFFLFLFALLVDWIFGWSAYGWTIFIALIYLLLSLRATYQQSYLKCILKALFILPIYILFIGIALVIMVIGSVLLT